MARYSTVDRSLAALADPTRRAIVEMLATRPRRAGEVAAAFPVAHPSISRHLRILERTRVITYDRTPEDGRVRIYRLRDEPLQAVDDWLGQIRGFWQSRLHDFKRHVEEGP